MSLLFTLLNGSIGGLTFGIYHAFITLQIINSHNQLMEYRLQKITCDLSHRISSVPPSSHFLKHNKQQIQPHLLLDNL